MKVPLRRGGAAAELCGPAAFFDAWSDAWPDGLSEGLSGAGSAAALRGAARAVSSATPSMLCGCAPAPSPPEARSTAASMAMMLSRAAARIWSSRLAALAMGYSQPHTVENGCPELTRNRRHTHTD